MIPSDLYAQGVQLAAPSKEINQDIDAAISTLVDRGFHFEMKFDGIRSLAFVDDGVARLINRRGTDIGFRYPEIIEALESWYAGTDVVLDGEIVVYTDGKVDFDSIHRRDAQTNPAAVPALAKEFPATLMAFDLLHYRGDDMRRIPYAARTKLLNKLSRGSGPTLQWTSSRMDGAAFFAECKEHGLEGLIAKDPKSLYHSGRKTDWVKLKLAFQISAVAISYTEGKGDRKGKLGAVELALVHGQQIVPIGRVGTGFTYADLDTVQTYMDNGELLVLEIECSAITREAKLRFPSFKGIRTDKTAVECTTDQLEGIPII